MNLGLIYVSVSPPRFEQFPSATGNYMYAIRVPTQYNCIAVLVQLYLFEFNFD